MSLTRKAIFTLNISPAITLDPVKNKVIVRVNKMENYAEPNAGALSIA